MLDGIETNYMVIIAPIVVLFVTMFAVTLVFKIFFSWLPKRLFDFLIGPVALFGIYIWAIPMNAGFHELFK